MPYFKNKSNDTRSREEQLADPKYCRMLIPSEWTDAQFEEYVQRATLCEGENKIRVMFLVCLGDKVKTHYCKEKGGEDLMREAYKQWLKGKTAVRRDLGPHHRFYILLDPPFTNNCTLPAIELQSTAEMTVRKKKQPSDINCVSKKLILTMIYMHPLQEILKTALILGWSISAWADPDTNNPLILLTLLPAALLGYWSYSMSGTAIANRVRDSLFKNEKERVANYSLLALCCGKWASCVLGFDMDPRTLTERTRTNIENTYYTHERALKTLRALLIGLQMSLMAYALFTRSTLSPCVALEQGLPLPQVPQEYYIPLISSIALGLVHMTRYLFFTEEGSVRFSSHSAGVRLMQKLIQSILYLPIPFELNFLSLALHLSAALSSIIPFLAIYCVVPNLIFAASMAAAFMAFEQGLIFNRYNASYHCCRERNHAFSHLLYPVQWLLDAVTHTMAAIVGFLFDPLIFMGTLRALCHGAMGWVLGSFWNLYLSPYVQNETANQIMEYLPLLMAVTGLFAGVTEVLSFLMENKAHENLYYHPNLLKRYELFFSPHIGLNTACARYKEHAQSVAKWINDVTKATGKMLGCYRPKQGVGFFCCDSSGVPVSEATVVMMDDPVGPAVDYGTRTPSSSQKEEAVTKPPHSFRDFFKAGAKELGALCGKRELPVAAR